VNARVLPVLGEDTPVRAIATEDVDKLRSKLLEQVSHRTAQKVMMMVHGGHRRSVHGTAVPGRAHGLALGAHLVHGPAHPRRQELRARR
jgi:hypothetical protein